MNENTIKVLADSMNVDPDMLRTLDESYHNDESERDPEVNQRIAAFLDDLKTVLCDESASMSVRTGFALSVAALAVALEKQHSVVQVYLDLARQCAQAEREAAQEMLSEIGVMVIPIPMGALMDDEDDPDEINAPDCPECGEVSFYCRFHQGWECGNRECPHTGLIDTGTE